MACFRVINNDDTTTKGLSQYITLKKCFGTHELPEASAADLGGGVRSRKQLRTALMKTRNMGKEF
jgi:hypothetical protein